MTREEVLAMVPGRELDELIAEKVMGWERDFQCWKDENGRIRTIEPTSFGSFEPSTDISAAWEVVTKLSKDYGVSVYEDDGAACECSIFHWSKEPKINVEASTAPEAICKAALLSLIKEETP